MIFRICFGCILCLHFRFMAVDAVLNFDSELRLKRAANNQAPQGKCLSFKLDRKSYHQAIEYVCCNNCFVGNGNCVGRVHPSSHSNRYYCNSCGTNQLNSARKTSEPFFCGDCRLQTLKENSCRKSYSGIPPGCWLFRACFENTCRNDGIYGSNQHYNPPLSSGGVEGEFNPDARFDGGGGRVVPAFSPKRNIPVCFDGFCHVREHESCPADCCPIRNPEKCAVAQGSCPPECCGKSSCCVENDEESKNILTMIFMYVAPPFGCVCISCMILCFYRSYKKRHQRVHVEMTLN